MAATVLEVLITGDATQLKLAFTQATAATEQYAAATKSASAATTQSGLSAKIFGNAAQYAFTAAKLGVLAFAAASAKSAIDFNREFTMIAAITNTAASSIGGLKDTVLNLARETAQSPTDVAHSLYFLASAGLSTSQQMEALEASSKAAAIGLGDSGDLARISANALNAFSDQGLTAAQVMDTLVAAVREGTAEPDEFASALGRVLPIADNAGISFQSVAASLAAMSNAGLDVNEGVTALRAILQSLTAPTAQTQAAFKEMGLSVDQVVRSMQENGLIATLRTVQDAAKAATDSQGDYNVMMRHAIPNIRGLAGAFNLLGQNGDKIDGMFQRIKNSTGDMATAFQTTAESPAFRIKQALNDLLIAGQQVVTAALGPIAMAVEALVPPLAAALPLITNMGAAWLLLKIVPPILTAVSGAMGTLGAVIGVTAEEVVGMTAAWNPWLVGLGLAAAALAAISGNGNLAIVVLGGLAIEIARVTSAINASQAALGAIGIALLMANKAWTAYKDLQTQVATASSGFAQQMEAQNDSLANTAGRVEEALGPRQKFLDSFFSSHPNFQAYQAWDQGVQQLKDDIAAQNNQITQGTDLMATYGNILNNTSTTSLALHGALATVLTDYYKQNDGLRGLNTMQLNALVSAGKWHAAIVMVTDALERNDAAIRRQSQSAEALHQSIIAGDFARLAPFLGSIGESFGQFQAEASTAFNGTQADADKFISDMTQKWTDAWDSFKSTAVGALDFTGKALSDLGDQASSAMDQLAGDTSGMAKDALAELGDQANITTGEIISSFKEAAAQTKAFGQDLLDIAKFGPAGKALASSLLQSGNTVAAATIAGASKATEQQIVNLYGKNESMVDSLATKLTNSIVGPLDKIVSLLQALAKHWGLTIDPHTDKAKKSVGELRDLANRTARQNYRMQVGLQDDASRGLHGIQADTDHLVGNVHKLQIAANTDVAKRQLANFDSTLDAFLSKKRTINIGVHTGPESPWPDEAIKQHLTDPMKQTGFKRIGDAYTLPLSVGVHTNDPSTFQGGTAPRDARTARDAQRRAVAGLGDLKRLEQRQLQVLFDIRRELKGIHSGGGGGMGGGSNLGGGSLSSDTGTNDRHRQTRDGGSHGGLSPLNIGTPLQRAVRDIFQKEFKSGVTPGEALGVIKRVAREGRDPKFIGGAIKDMTKELGPAAAREFGHSLRHLDARTATNAKHQQAALDAARKAFEQMTENAKHSQLTQAQQQKREEARKEWMADALAYATHNVPRLPRGHTHIDPNEHERRHHHKRMVSLNMDRKRFVDSAGYEVDYGRGF